MAIMKKTVAPKAAKPAPAVRNPPESIEAQVAAFLQAGGEIQKVAKGASAARSTAPSRQITISKKR
ncbi:hypothetical protein P4110_11095 [Pseudomonas aeruginosa]|nr:hypothetical protein [Pseudomonas aeruginosa]